METIRSILQHMVHDRDTIPNKHILLMTYMNVLMDELRHWQYQETCWNDGSYGDDPEKRADGIAKCAQRIRIINGILNELEA